MSFFMLRFSVMVGFAGVGVSLFSIKKFFEWCGFVGNPQGYPQTRRSHTGSFKYRKRYRYIRSATVNAYRCDH